MSSAVERCLSWLSAHDSLHLPGRIQRGIEKESLRIRGDGTLSQKPHPQSLGSALTHPYITTDYSESLLEFITPPIDQVGEALDFLTGIHHFVYQNIGAEKLWVASMPCIVQGDSSIPIAQYGTSNVGLMKHVYRRGLGHRYGRLMQAIAGIHYNFSIDDGIWELQDSPWRFDSPRLRSDNAYLGLVRNFHRYCWLLLYLFGASPAVCRSFLANRDHFLEPLGPSSLYLPHATSLRMSPLGYQNDAQAGINVDYNSIERYTDALIRATETPYADYRKIGVVADGEYRQLNTHLLQIENEYYTVIRPKQVARSGEKPSTALRSRGVRYVEARCLDLNPFEPAGLSADQAMVCDLFLLYCLFEDSPAISPSEQDAITSNRNEVVMRGRQPGLELHTDGRSIPLKDWARQIFSSMELLTVVFDSGVRSQYMQALAHVDEAISDPQQTLSAKVLDELRGNRESFFEFAMRKSMEHEQHFKNHKMDGAVRQEFQRWAVESLQSQQNIEQQDDVSFEEYLEHYFAG